MAEPMRSLSARRSERQLAARALAHRRAMHAAEAVTALRGGSLGLMDFVDSVLVLASSSRSGSTVTQATLSGISGLWITPGETAPYDSLVMPTFPERNSDGLGGAAPHEVERWRRDLVRLLSLEAIASGGDGAASPRVDRPGVALRLVWQWPGLVDFDRALDLVERIAAERSLSSAGGWDIRDVASRLEADEQRRAGELCRFYDGGGRPHDGATTHRLPFDALVEEPPFIVLSEAPDARRLRGAAPNVLLLKGPAWAYRLEVLLAMFGPRLKVLHLTRNPAAAINGLIDGWLSPSGFFSRRMYEGPGLAIDGYSNRFSWGRDWWKFDLPPGWRDMRRACLVDVCAFQWVSAHRAIADFHMAHPEVPYLRLRFESLIGGDWPRRVFADAVHRFIGLPASGDQFASVLRRPVMSTAPPQRFRWQARADELQRALEAEAVVCLAREMGYVDDRGDWL